MNPLNSTFSTGTENLLMPVSSTKASESSIQNVDFSQTSALGNHSVTQLAENDRSSQLFKKIVFNPEADTQETKEAQKFQATISDAKNSGKEEDKKNGTFGTKDSTWYGAAVHTYSKEEYSNMRLFLSANALCGFAIKDFDIISVFKHKNETRKVIDIITPQAIALRGKRLDCFNIRTVLPFMYSKYGFIPVAKVKFDENEAPEDWNYARDGTPDTIFMVYSESVAKAEAITLQKQFTTKNQ